MMTINILITLFHVSGVHCLFKSRNVVFSTDY